MRTTSTRRYHIFPADAVLAVESSRLIRLKGEKINDAAQRVSNEFDKHQC